MELMAAEMGLALAKKLIMRLEVKHQNIFLWTDSRAVHDWIRVESRALQVFVKNRVLKIRQYLRLEQILWVPGALNPADAATRGLTVEKLKEAKNWLLGPDFLKTQEDMWPVQPPEPGRDLADIIPETITGLKKTRGGNKNELLLTSTAGVCLFSIAPARDDYGGPQIPILLKLSEWPRLVNIVAFCRSMGSRKKGDITPLEKIEAERALVFHSQRASYQAALFQLRTHDRVNHDSTLASLAPFLDVQGLIRLAGRIEAAPLVYEAKYPLLLHAKDPMTELLLRHIHKQLMHTGGLRAIQRELSKRY
jgi:hypothetical protein